VVDANRDDRARLRLMIDGYQVSQAIAVAAELGIADLLAAGPRRAEELAQATGAHRRSLLRLLRALAAIGVLVEVAGGERTFGLSPLGDGLRSDAPGSVWALAIQAGQPAMWAAWGDLRHSVMSGESAFRHIHGMGAWDYRAQHPDAGERFDRAMEAGAKEIATRIVAAYDFGGVRRVVDVGGGHGALLAEILGARPAVRGVLFDLPRVVEAAGPVLEAAGVGARCEVVGGDLFAEVPAGGDVYVLKGVIHDWDDADAIRILRNCRRVMGAGSKLLVIEQVIPDDRGAEPFTLFMDLHMLAIHGAGERTVEEFGELFTTAGFRLGRVVPVDGAMRVLEASPVLPYSHQDAAAPQ
jgi:SAM-dependent methyltransferase